MSVLLVAPIGAPFRWQEVEYSAPWAKVDIKSRTSIRLVYELLSNKGIKPRVVVFALDTLSAHTRVTRGEPVEGAKCLPDPLENLDEDQLEPAKYHEFMYSVGMCISYWFSRFESINVDAVILPGFGEHRYITISGEARRAYWRLSRDLEKRGVEPMEYLMAFQALHLIKLMQEHFSGGKAELHVDLTHGINYVGYSLYRAALFASRVYSAASRAEVEVTIYNSEPYVAGVEKLNVWIVRRERIRPKAAASRLVYASLAERSREGPYEKLRVDDVIVESREISGRVKREVNRRLGKLRILNYSGWPAAAAVLIGAPLLLAQAWLFAKEGGLSSEELKGYPSMLLDALPLVKVRKGLDGESKVEIEHVAALSYGHLKKLAALAALTLYSRHALMFKGVKVATRASRLPCSRKEKRVVVASLKALEDISKGMLAGPSKAIVENEIANFIRAIKDERVARDYMLSAEAHKVCSRAEDLHAKRESLDGGIDRRVFAAHAGLTARAITVESECSTDPKTSLKIYYDPCLLDRVREAAQNLMKDTAESIFVEEP
ncbi:MAG: CRISPR-associated DxTHG motif protein [Desulfurococcales archaeon]|nr:CRISPR-associated DxTHG motif protein [Desulfurococcales archaeon]